jgi:hypothetical protein
MLSAHFIYYYAECRYSECRYAECCYAECRYAECRYAECRYAECRYAECRSARFNIDSRGCTIVLQFYIFFSTVVSWSVSHIQSLLL